MSAPTYRKLDIRLMSLPPHLRAVGGIVIDQMDAPGMWGWLKATARRVWELMTFNAGGN